MIAAVISHIVRDIHCKQSSVFKFKCENLMIAVVLLNTCPSVPLVPCVIGGYQFFHIVLKRM